ncbi:MAG: hypothetical protein H0X51_09695 [Parachlamydiaceae bacterium]|nr:hypothetical protein [Parachlamydiaceae bacterium]
MRTAKKTTKTVKSTKPVKTVKTAKVTVRSAPKRVTLPKEEVVKEVKTKKLVPQKRIQTAEGWRRSAIRKRRKTTVS